MIFDHKVGESLHVGLISSLIKKLEGSKAYEGRCKSANYCTGLILYVPIIKFVSCCLGRRILK